MRKAIRRGDLFYADLNPVIGSEQGGIRPVLVIQMMWEITLVLPLLRQPSPAEKQKNSLPTHILLRMCGACAYLSASVGTTADNRPEAAVVTLGVSAKKKC